MTSSFKLLSIIVSDITRNLLRVLLFLLVVASAIAVILSSHHNRQLMIKKEKALQERDRLDVEWRNLILEQGALTEHNRIESLVEKKLNMYRPGPDEEVVVRVK